MNRTMSMFGGALLFLAPFLVGQNQQTQWRPSFREDSLSARQLIAWTWMQQPQPLPQNLPPPDKSIPPADQTPTQTANLRDGNQIFIGKIASSGDRLVLQTPDGNVYPFGSQNDATPYEGKNVRIIGTTGSDRIIQIVTIEILS